LNRETTIKRARRLKRPEERQHDKNKIKTLIELAGYSIVAPTNGKVHPSGNAYARRMDNFSTIAAYTAEERDALIELARSFDTMPRKNVEPRPKGSEAGILQGEYYTSKMSWLEVLEAKGWVVAFSRDGIGICDDQLRRFRFSAFDAETSYTRFGAYATLKHGGDFQRG
jgi:hypothetical protein